MAAYAFFHRPLFSRAWIVQEIALACRAVFFCGTLAGHWDAITMAAVFLNRSRWDSPMLEFGSDHALDADHATTASAGYPSGCMVQRGLRPGFNPIILVLELAELRMKLADIKDDTNMLDAIPAYRTVRDQKESFLALLLKSYGTISTLPDDKVYALLSLAREDGWLGLTVDYNRNTKDTFIEATWAMIRSESSLAVLLAIQDNGKHGIVENLPSWVPDFGIAIDQGSHTTWDASKGLTWNDSTTQTNEASFRFHVSGFRTDTLDEIADFDRSSLASVLSLIRPAGTGPLTKLDVLWRTLTLDRYRGEHPAPVHCGEVFRQLMRSNLEKLHLAMIKESKNLDEDAGGFMRAHAQFLLEARA